MGSSQTPITLLLHRWRGGDSLAFEEVWTHLEVRLHRQAASYMARERAGHTLQPTALLHEIFLQLRDEKQVDWADRGHFLAIAAKMMRRALRDSARARQAAKRGAGVGAGSLDDLLAKGFEPSSFDAIPLEDVLAIDQALQQLEVLDPRKAAAIEMEYFGGMTQEEIAAELGVSRATAVRDLTFGRAALRKLLLPDEPK